MEYTHRLIRSRSYPSLGRVAGAQPARSGAPGKPRVLWDKESRTGTEDGTGTITVDFGVPPAGYTWLIDRMVISTDSASATTLKVYTGPTNLQAQVEDYTTAGNADVADNNAPIPVEHGEQLRCVFTGASAGAVATVRISRRTVPAF